MWLKSDRICPWKNADQQPASFPLCPKCSRLSLKMLQHGICSLAAVGFPSTSFVSVISLETAQSKKYCYCTAFNLSGSFKTPSWHAGKHWSMRLTTEIKRVFKKEKHFVDSLLWFVTSRHCPTYATELLKQISQCCNRPPGFLLMRLDNHIKLRAACQQPFFLIQ